MVLRIEVYEMGNKYSFKKTLEKTGKYLLFFGVPAVLEHLVSAFPEYSGLTLGTLAVAAANWLKHKN